MRIVQEQARISHLEVPNHIFYFFVRPNQFHVMGSALGWVSS